MSHKIGRNDKCHCGSGKKYKHCHLASDERQTPVAKPAAWAQAPAQPSLPQPDPRMRERILDDLATSIPPHAREQVKQELARSWKAQPLLEFLEQRERIRAAAAQLETYREEFEKLTERKDTFLERAQTLFEQETFAPLRFTAAEVGKALRTVGFAPSAQPDKKLAKKVRSALLRLANRERRRELSLALMKHLPDFVAAGRYMDAWMIQSMAVDLLESKDSNPFLLAMFYFGFNDYVQERTRTEDALLRELGFDSAQVQNTSLEELEARLKERASDPTFEERIDAILAAHPEQEKDSMIQFRQLESECFALFGRNDAASLLLSRSEVEPWVHKAAALWSRALHEAQAEPGRAPTKKALQKVQQEFVLPLLEEMEAALFPPQRRKEFVARLKAYREERIAAGEKQVALQTFHIIATLEGPEPSANPFLKAVCFHSIRAVMRELSEEPGAAAAEPVP